MCIMTALSDEAERNGHQGIAVRGRGILGSPQKEAEGG